MTWMHVSAMHGNQAYPFISLQFSFLPLIRIRKTQKRNQFKKKWVKWGKRKFEFFFIRHQQTLLIIHSYSLREIDEFSPRYWPHGRLIFY